MLVVWEGGAAGVMAAAVARYRGDDGGWSFTLRRHRLQRRNLGDMIVGSARLTLLE